MSGGLPRVSDFRADGGESGKPLPRTHRMQDPATALNRRRLLRTTSSENKMTLFGFNAIGAGSGLIRTFGNYRSTSLPSLEKADG